MKYKNIILVYIVFMTMEDFILKWLPLSDRLYSLSRSLSEVFLYLLLALVLISKSMKGKLNRSLIDYPLLFLIVIGIASTLYNQAPLAGGLINMKALFRYFAVFYIILNISISYESRAKFLTVMVILAVIQSVLGIFQHFVGIDSLWLPRVTDLEISGISKDFKVLDDGGIEQGAAIGLFGHPVAMSLYLFISACIICSAIYLKMEIFKLKWLWLIFFLVVASIFFTYSRGTAICALGLFPLILWIDKKYKKLAILLFVGVLALIPYSLISSATEWKNVKEESVNPLDNFTMIFSGEYLAHAENSRLWMLTEVVSNILMQFNLFGYGADEDTAREKIADNSDGLLERILYYRGFEDVYWVAILSYYGVVGLLIMLFLMYRLYRMSKYVYENSENENMRVIALSFLLLVISTLMLTFLVRTFEFRSFGFYFFLLAGLVAKEYIDLQKGSAGESEAEQLHPIRAI